MNKQTIAALKTGWNMRNKVKTSEEFADLLELRRLNERSKTAWERENDGDLSEAQREGASKAGEMAWATAEKICKRNGWKLSAPGLWWEIRDSKGNDLTVRV